MASTCVKRTPSSDGNSKKFTWSGWVKRGQIGAGQHLWSTWYQNNSRYSYFQFNADDTLEVYSGEYSTSPTTPSIYLNTTAKFSDTFGWYHIVLRVDTDDSTQADRVRVYVNGVNQAFNASHSNGQTLPSSGTVTFFNKQYLHTLGRYANSGGFFSGIMSHVHWCDGYSYAPTEFGEEDSSTGEWKIKTSPSVSYGTNGFFILKDGNSTTDQSGNSMSFTTEGTLTNTEDNPSHVFATWDANFLGSGASLDNGNTSCNMDATAQFGACSTLGMTSGKYYMEMKYSSRTHSADRVMLGITSDPNTLRHATPFSGGSGSGYVGNDGDPTGHGYYSDGGIYYNDDNGDTSWTDYTVGDIIGIALDLDNHKIYFHKNGTYENSGVPTSGSTGTGAKNVSTSPTSGFYFFACTDTSGSYGGTIQANFGNGYFGTTAISSEGTNASGIGKFEYDVPTGYTALSTKGLNE